MSKDNNKNTKISRTWKCNCGWLHIAEGPCSCWVCMDSIGFAKWQTGKEAPEMPYKLIHNFYHDKRNRIKSQVTITREGVNKTDGAREMCWAEEPGPGRYGRDLLYDHGHK
jgi:hypothetical protein